MRLEKSRRKVKALINQLSKQWDDGNPEWETMSTGCGTEAKLADKTLQLYEIMHNKFREIRRR